MSERSANSLGKTMFTAEYALEQYEPYSASSRRYEATAQILAGLNGGNEDGEIVVELGSGTGNSSIVLAEMAPNVGKIICVEPSRGFLGVAGYKFGVSGLYIPPETDWPLPEVTSYYIAEMRHRAEPFRNKVRCVQGRVEFLPLESEFADKVYANQVFHWFAFADDDQKGERIGHLDESIKEIARVLVPGGKFIFDTSGLQFDFEQAKIYGESLADLHMLTHPFHNKFIECFNASLVSSGFYEEAFVDPNRIGKYNRILNLKLIESRLNAFGLNLIPTEQGEPYKTTLIPLTTEDFEDSIRYGGKMRYFDGPVFKDWSDTDKASFVENVLEKTKQKHGDLLHLPANEIVVSFVAQKS